MPTILAKYFYLLVLLNLGIAQTASTSRLFNISWEERRPFKIGLIKSERTVLRELPLATVYHIALDLTDVDQIRLKQEVRVFNKQNIPTKELYFYLFPNLLGGKIVLNKLELNGQTIIPTYENENTLLHINLLEPLAPSEASTVYFELTLELPKENKHNYNILTFDEDILSLAHIYPTLAVQDPELGWVVSTPSPQGDLLFAESSFFLLQVTLPKNMKLVSSGQIIKREKKDNKKLLTIAAGPVRDIFLVASKHFHVLEAKLGKTKVYSYYVLPPKANSKQILDYNLNYTLKALGSFNTRFGQYPFKEFDLVPLPTSALGVEFPGIIGVSTDIYKTSNKNLLESVIAHEVGHQWFYSVIGNDQTKEPWLDEVLTQYATWLYYKDQYGQQGYEDFRNSLESRWRAVNNVNLPIDEPVEYYTSYEYSGIIYGLGALVLEDLAKEMGKVTFDCFLQDYYQNNKWGIVRGEDFFELAEQHCNCKISFPRPQEKNWFSF